MVESIPKTPRLRRNRGKTGCRTCRVRRIKCDEARPVCVRCSSTGRTCDGYEMPSTALVQAARTSKARRPLLSKPSSWVTISVLDLSVRESENFDFFRRHTAREIPGCFRSAVWEQFVLQISHREPAILHAAVAVGAMHRTSRAKSPSMQALWVYEAPRHSFALAQYVKSLGLLRSRLDAVQDQSGDGAVDIALLACLLFVCLEMLQGNRIGAMVHLRTGLRILAGQTAQVHYAYGEGKRYLVRSSQSGSLMDGLTSIFCRLDYDATMFGERSPVLSLPCEQGVPSTFTSLDEARHYLYALHNAVFHFRGELLQRASLLLEEKEMDWVTRHCVQYATARKINLSQDVALGSRLDRLKTALTVWLLSFRRLCRAFEPLRECILLEIQHFYIFFIIHTWQDVTEVSCDRFNETFGRIVALADTFIHNSTTVDKSDTLTFTLESGIIPSLYMIALKCRQSIIRRHAISLLYSTSCQEGMWEGALIAKFTEQLADMEDVGTGWKDDSGAADIPEGSRFSDVALAGSEDQPGYARLICARFAHETTGELVVCEKVFKV